MYNNKQYEWKNITGVNSPAITVFSGSGTFHSVVINSIGTGGYILLTDAGSPAVTIGTITLSGSPFTTLLYDISISGGLTVKTSGSPNITLTWQK